MTYLYSTGLYRGRVVSQETGTTQRGTPQIVIAFELLEDRRFNTIRNVYLYLTPNAERRTREALQELAFYDDFRYLSPQSIVCQSLVGRECHLVCTHERYAGKVREKWSIAIPRFARTE